jgi:hypothetical protein
MILMSEVIDLTGNSDSNDNDSDVQVQRVHTVQRTPGRMRRSSSQVDSQEPRSDKKPHQNSRPPLSPPPLKRLSDASATSVSVGRMDPSPSNLSTHPSPQHSLTSRDENTNIMTRPLRTSSGVKLLQQVTPPSSHLGKDRQESQNLTPKKQTPKKSDWDVDSIAESLKAFSQDIKTAHRQLCAYIIDTTKPIDRRIQTGTDLFAGARLEPVEEEKDVTLKIKFKVSTRYSLSRLSGPSFPMEIATTNKGRQQHVRGKKEHNFFKGSREPPVIHYKATCIKSDIPAVPRYRFHHIEISKNILSPNTMLKFVPHLRDLEDSEERQYNMWLEELEDMDKVSGFKHLKREEKVKKTVHDEWAATLSLYLDHWLKRLALDGCNKPALIRYMASQEEDDAITPKQKSSIISSYGEESQTGSPHTKRAAQMFTEAFDRVFKSPNPKGKGVALRDVLLLDESVESIVDSKKMGKAIPSSQNSSNEKKVEAHLESYCVLGCLICYSNSCEHGEYDVQNQKRNFSIECKGRLTGLLQQRRQIAAKEQQNGTLLDTNSPDPCHRDCYLIRQVNRSSQPLRPWNEGESMLLRCLFVTFDHSKINMKPQCVAADILDRRCFEVHQELLRLDISVPEAEHVEPPKIKGLQWYDRQKKILVGDWQDHTVTHEYQRRELLDPCNHDGPCSAARGCPCVIAGVLCERFCRCTADICAYKFTGCACHGNGKTCHSKQKEKPCICVQLNRECDPTLCGTCGAHERADSKNALNEALFNTGCQNCALQRGVTKRLMLGKSQLEGVGYGLFTAEEIAQDEFVVEYVGELITHDEGVRREARRGDVFNQESNSSYLFTLLEHEGIWVDAAIYGNLSRYINHASESDKRGCNITPKILYVNGEYRIRFTAIRDIRAGEELFFNYGENFPNLTKKLLEDKADQEDGPTAPRRKGRPRRSDAEQATTTRKPKRNKPGGARKEAPTEPGDDWSIIPDVPLQRQAPPSKRGRKRKRKSGEVEEDEEEDYQPEIPDSQVSDSAGTDGRILKRRPGRPKRTSKVGIDQEWSPSMAAPVVEGGKTPTSSRRRNILAETPSNLWHVESEDSDTVPAIKTPTKKRGRKPKVRPEIPAEQAEAIPAASVDIGPYDNIEDDEDDDEFLRSSRQRQRPTRYRLNSEED